MAKKYIQEFKSKLATGGTVSPEELQDFFSRLEGDLKDKKYGLVWESQTEQVIEQLKTNKVYLEEDLDLKITKDPDNPKSNILIEGDNYEALTYLNEINQKVDVIYIDPPYNTGNKDFIYNDRFIDKEDGFRHSQWLSFMDARLRLARELLTDDGVIFISIDENEFSNLDLLCSEIFGGYNRIAQIVRDMASFSNDSKNITTVHEYVLVYAKNKNLLTFTKDVFDMSAYKYEDIHLKQRGRYKLNKMDNGSMTYSDSMNYPIICPDGSEIYPNSRKSKENDGWNWRWSQKKIEWGIENDFIVFKKVKGEYKVYYKIYENVDRNLKEIKRGKPYTTIIRSVGTEGNKNIGDIGMRGLFNYPKPVSMIKYLVNMHPNSNATVLDFFAGSGTTGQAVLELNQEDGGSRQFILVTNNENNIARDVTYERNKRVIEGYTTPKGKDITGIPANLAYYRTKQVSKYGIDFDEVMLQHIIPTIQFTEGVYHRIRHSEHILQLGENIFIFNQYMVDDDEIDTLVGLVKDEDILYIQEGQVDYIKSKLPEGVVYKYLEGILPTNR